MLTIYVDGVRRVLRAPAIWFGAWLATMLLALPLAVALRSMLAAHLGDSLAAEAALEHVNYDWWQEFTRQASGIGTTFRPSVIGIAAVLANVSGLLGGARLDPVLGGAVTAWLVVWSFLSGGMLDRYARNRPTWTTGFFAACGTHFFRFLRLGVMATLVYYGIFVWLDGWLIKPLWNQLTRNVAVERTAFVIALGLYAGLAALVVGTSLVFDYARIRIVVEDRRSALGAMAAGLRFVRRHPRQVFALYALNTMTFLLAAGLYALVSPGVWRGGPMLWVGFAIGQVWIAARVGIKLAFYATGVCLFQRELAHGEYVAASVPDWPESPAAEAIRSSKFPVPGA